MKYAPLMMSGWEDKQTNGNWTEDEETENETKNFSYVVLMLLHFKSQFNFQLKFK